MVGWKIGVDMEINFKSSNIINGLIFFDPINEPWLISFVYGPPNHSNRGLFWEAIEKVGDAFSGGWMCIGDFNHVFSQADKKGGKLVSNSSRGGPNEVIDKKWLIDLQFSGNPYTWPNKREGFANIKERLDRAFANDRWRLIFPRAVVHNLPTSTLDHSPIVLFTEGEQRDAKKPFKFEEAWTRDETSFFVVEKAWRSDVYGTSLFKVCRKIKETKNEFRRWDKEWFGNIQKRIKDCWDQLEKIQNEDPIQENLNIEANINLELREWLQREEMLWRKKSRTKFLVAADLNTKFFYLITIIIRRRNAIDFLKNQQGIWVSGREEIGKCFEDFFTNLFTSSNPSIPSNLENLITPSLFDEDIEMLSKIPSPEEIKEVVFSIGSNKAPGPDGMSVHFFKCYWNIIGGEVIEANTTFFQRGHMLKEINHSFIVLIPKGSNAAIVSQYRPKSLCNVLYKIFSKLQANKLKQILPKLISPSQTTFVPS